MAHPTEPKTSKKNSDRDEESPILRVLSHNNDSLDPFKRYNQIQRKLKYLLTGEENPLNPQNSPSTSISLIDQAKQNDQEAWRTLCDIYSPLVYQWARRGGLQENDAADVVQDVFRIVVKNLKRFHRDQSGDTFRGWLWTITRNEIRGWFRKVARSPEKAIGGTDAVHRFSSIPDWVHDDSGIHEIENDAAAESLLIRRAAEAIKNDFADHTWQAFWRSTVDGQPVAEIAADLKMTAGSVRQAKFRVLARLREYIG